MKNFKMIFVLLLSVVVFVLSVTTDWLYFSETFAVISVIFILASLIALIVNYYHLKSVKEIEEFFEDLSEEDLDKFVACEDDTHLSNGKISFTIENSNFALYDCTDCVMQCMDCWEFKVRDLPLVDICSKKGSVFVEDED